jgi:hypothetical protein
MTKLLPLIALVLCTAAFAPATLAREAHRTPLPAKSMQANSVYVDCICPRGLAVARETAVEQLKSWGRFQISQNRRQTDLVLLFSGNPYLGDYITRDGPDTRNVSVDITFLTVIDPNTGKSLWTDSRQWGSWRVKGATKDLLTELREQMEGQVKRWSLDDILMCSVTPVYAGFAHLTPDEAIAKSDSGGVKASGTPDRLMLSSLDAPAFCQRAQVLFSPDHRIIGFEVPATQADDLEIGDVLQQADRFDFAGGKYSEGDKVYFDVQSKDKKIRILFDMEGSRTVLSQVSFFY